MSHVLVGDGHYRGSQDELERWAALVERMEQDEITELSVMGDFFELWLALEGVMPAWQDAMLAPLERLRKRGVYLRYVVGNKDYFVDAWNEKVGLFDRVVDGVEICQSPQGPLHLAHGDRVNRADRQYRAWRAFSRSRPIQAAARALPRRTLKRLGGHLAERLETTNRAHKMEFPQEELEARARELPAGEATQIYGHFHVYRDFQVADKRVITLPFLATETAGILVDDAGFHRYPPEG